jgi:hypothetical protein
MVMGLDAGNIDSSNCEEAVVFAFTGVTETKQQPYCDSSNIHSSLPKSIFPFCLLFIAWLKVKMREAYVPKYLTLQIMITNQCTKCILPSL